LNSDQLVSVVIPAYNAASTIAETLRSVRSQTHEALEIIVVDDGSTDHTRDIVATHAAVDPRIRMIAQQNAGVAAARNNGWRNARADLIAFVDADDLWSPRKIEHQLEVMQRSGERVGLVYCWYALIDGEGRILDERQSPTFEGEVLDSLFQGNFIGNGSSALVRRQALADANGFESGLRSSGAQGCEDILFYCRVAQDYEFGVVPDRHVGYRYLPNNMSSDFGRMLRSWLLVVAEMEKRHPKKKHLLKKGLSNYSRWLVRKCLFDRRPGHIADILLVLFPKHPLLASAIVVQEVPVALARMARRRIYRWRRARRAASAAVHPPRRFQIGEAS
jgi:glycosyltransferase involved in cell wall biosynthesis